MGPEEASASERLAVTKEGGGQPVPKGLDKDRVQVGTAEGEGGPPPTEGVPRVLGGVEANKLDQAFDPGNQRSMGERDPCARAVGVAEQLRFKRAVAGGCHIEMEGRCGAQGIAWDGGQREF